MTRGQTSRPWNPEVPFDTGFPGYVNKVLDLAPTNLVGFWQLDESSGAVVNDISGNEHDGSYTDIDLGEQGIAHDGKTSVAFDGLTSVINLYSAGLVAQINGAEGAFSTWIKVSGSGIWSDGISRIAFRYMPNNTNLIDIRIPVAANQLEFLRFGGGVQSYTAGDFLTTDDWINVIGRWSETRDEVEILMNGIVVGSTATGLGVWDNTQVHIDRFCIGAADTVATTPYSGYAQYGVLFDRWITDAEALVLASGRPRSGAVALAFADDYSSVYDDVYPLMEARDLQGTTFTISSTVGTGAWMTSAQLQELYVEGWDIANHTENHNSLSTLTYAQQVAEITGCEDDLNGWALYRASRIVEYPGGIIPSYNADTLSAMADSGMLMGFMGDDAVLFNPLTIDKYEIPVANVLLGGLAWAKNLAQRTIANNQIWIYSTHDIGGALDLTLADYELFLDYLVANQIAVLTVTEVLDRLP